MTELPSEKPRKITDDPYGAAILIRRLVAEQGLAYWRRYLLAFALMGLAAATTAGSAYLLGEVINKAYVDKDVRGIAILSLVTIVIFTIKGAATYGHTVILSQIGNAILANNQRALFAKLMSENIAFFSERHSSEFLARLTAGATAVTQVLNLLINAIGRDLLSLIALVVVMVMTDPMMALLGFAVAPPAMIVLRKLVKRIKGLAHNQFSGTADIMETMQESLQGIRTVKAFTLEQAMRDRIDASITAVERNANKMARVSNRSSPLMETLGGFAIAGGLMYGGYRVVAMGASPGQFFSFLTAFLLAYEPAKRLARLNIELNSNLIGARKLLEIVDSPPSEPDDGEKPALRLSDARVEFRDVTFGYRQNEPVLRRMSFVAEPGKTTALVGPSGGGKSTVLALLLRLYEVGDGAILIDGQTISDVSRHSLRAADRLCRAGRLSVPRHHRRQHRLRQGRRHPGRDRGGGESRLRPRLHHGLSAGLRHPGRRARHAAIRRPAPAHRGGAGAGQGCADHPARRSHSRAGFGIRKGRAGGDRASVPGPHHHRHRPPPAHHHARR